MLFLQTSHLTLAVLMPPVAVDSLGSSKPCPATHGAGVGVGGDGGCGGGGEDLQGLRTGGEGDDGAGLGDPRLGWWGVSCKVHDLSLLLLHPSPPGPRLQVHLEE